MAADTRPNNPAERRTPTDRPEVETNGQPHRFISPVAIASLTASRIADALVDPRIILPWLLTQVGAPGLVGLLVPVREAGARLPRSRLAATLRRPAGRKWIWAVARLVQGFAAFGIATSGLLLWGATAGWTILGLLLVIAMADGIVGFEPAKGASAGLAGRYRHLTGLTAAIGSAATGILALALILELGPRAALVIWALMGAGGLFLLAFLLLTILKSSATGASIKPAAPEPTHSAPILPWRRFSGYALLAPAALAPPYMVILISATPGRGLASLGTLLLASALAALLIPPLLGRFQSRRSLAATAALAAAALAFTVLADALGWLAAPWLLPALLFVVTAAGQVALAPTSRMRGNDDPAADTSVGLALLMGTALAPLAALTSIHLVLLILAALLALAVPSAFRFEERRPPADRT